MCYISTYCHIHAAGTMYVDFMFNCIDVMYCRYMVLHCIDYDRFSNNDSLGQVIIDLANFVPDDGLSGSFQLADLVRTNNKLHQHQYDVVSLSVSLMLLAGVTDALCAVCCRGTVSGYARAGSSTPPCRSSASRSLRMRRCATPSSSSTTSAAARLVNACIATQYHP